MSEARRQIESVLALHYGPASECAVNDLLAIAQEERPMRHVLTLPAGSEVTALAATLVPEPGVWIAVKDHDGSTWVTFCAFRAAKEQPLRSGHLMACPASDPDVPEERCACTP